MKCIVNKDYMLCVSLPNLSRLSKKGTSSNIALGGWLCLNSRRGKASCLAVILAPLDSYWLFSKTEMTFANCHRICTFVHESLGTYQSHHS